MLVWISRAGDALQRHLIRSLCTDLCDLIIRELDASASSKGGQFSIEVSCMRQRQSVTWVVFAFQERNKLIQKMPESNRSHLLKVNESLNGKVKSVRCADRTSRPFSLLKNVETTLARLEDAASELLQITLKRPNKKTEK